MEVKLNLQNIIKLINLYRSHPLLWDMSNKLYRRNDLKSKAFEAIANQMELPVEVVKKKIRNLRSTYTGEKRKIKFNKSGSGAEDQYISTIPWYKEMSFLDNTIVVRKTIDNSTEVSFNSESWEKEEAGFEEYFGTKTPTKSGFKEGLENKKPRKDTAVEKIDKVLEKIVNENETEYTTFGASIAHQLANMQVEPAYELMGEIQNLITKRKIKELRENRFQPLTSNAANSNNRRICSSTPTDILSAALTDAEIDFETDNETILF